MADSRARKISVCAHPDLRSEYKRLSANNSDVVDNIVIFNHNKRQIPPLALPKKMKDHKLKPPLDDFMECHLAADVLLIYTFQNDILHMLAITSHDEIKGPRGSALFRSLRKYLKDQD